MRFLPYPWYDHSDEALAHAERVYAARCVGYGHEEDDPGWDLRVVLHPASTLWGLPPAWALEEADVDPDDDRAYGGGSRGP